MNNRSANMHRINKIRSAKTAAIIDIIDCLEFGDDLDYGGYVEWDISYAYLLRGQINSYRAAKISQALGSNIQKQKLLKYAKPKNYNYAKDNNFLDTWLTQNTQNLERYLRFHLMHVLDG